MFGNLYKALGYQFKNIALLKEAITHPSMSFRRNVKRFDYERLEFLGDSLLSAIIATRLFLEHPNENEGELSKRKSFLVSTDSLCMVAKSLELDKYLILAHGEELNRGRENCKNLENAMEALIAAIFLDSDFDTVKEIVLRLWSSLDDAGSEVPKYAKTELQEWLQKYYKVLPIYELLKKEQLDGNRLRFKMRLKFGDFDYKYADGLSLKEAERKLAALALEEIEEFEQWQKNRGCPLSAKISVASLKDAVEEFKKSKVSK